jgi:ABC-type Zn uptake system ZnuABC Zn-binding protein ZnuA
VQAHPSRTDLMTPHARPYAPLDYAPIGLSDFQRLASAIPTPVQARPNLTPRMMSLSISSARRLLPASGLIPRGEPQMFARLPHRLTAAPLAIVATALLTLAAIGCAGPGATGPSPQTGVIDVVATTTVFADLVANVGGRHVQAIGLVPAGGDVHTFEAKPDDLRTVAKAKLLVMNGLGLDDWLEKTVTSANPSAPLIKLAVDLPGVQLLPGEEPGTQNPHLWMSVKYAELYADRIASELKQVDRQNAADYTANATAYGASLESLDGWVRQQIATIPAANRKIVTFHDAFPYFAREYGIEIVGVAVQAPGQDPSAAQIAALIQAIKAAGVKAIFSENQFPKKLVDQIGLEADASVVTDMYDDSLGDPPVTSYDSVIRWDVAALVDALK